MASCSVDTEGVKLRAAVSSNAVAVRDNNNEIYVEENSKYEQLTILVTFMIIVNITNMFLFLSCHRQCGMSFRRY